VAQIGRIPKSLFRKDLEFWQEALPRSEEKLQPFRDMWKHFVLMASRPYLTDTGLDNFGANWMFPEARSMLSNIFARDPSWEALNPDPSFAKDAEVRETILNNLWIKMQWSKPLRRAINHAWYSGFGPVKQRFVSGSAALPRLSPSDEMVSQITIALQEGDDERFAALLEGVGDPAAHDPNELVNFPSLINVQPTRFVFDPELMEFDLESARWIGEEIWLPTEFIKESPLYSKRARGQIEPTGRIEDRDGEATQEEWTKIYEVHDKMNGRIITMQPDQEIILRAIDFDDQLYDALAFNIVPDQPLPIPDASMIAPHAQDLDQIRARDKRLMQMQTMKMLYDGEMFTEHDSISGLLVGEDMAAIKVEVPQDKNIGQALFMPPIVQRPPSFDQQASLVKDDLRFASGASESRSGIASGGRQTATQIKSLDFGTQVRFASKLTMLEEFLSRIGRRVIDQVEKHWRPEMVAQFSGMSNNEDEQKASEQELVDVALSEFESPTNVPQIVPKYILAGKGQFVIRVKETSTAPQDELQRINKSRLLYLDMIGSPAVDNLWAAKWYFGQFVRGVDNAMPQGDTLQQAQQLGQGQFAPVGAPNDPGAQGQGQPEGADPQNQQGGQQVPQSPDTVSGGVG